MDFNVTVRKKQLESLNQYITCAKDRVQSILDSIGWNSEKVMESDPNITCPVNANHRILLSTANEHVKKCKIKTEGYDTGGEFLSEPTNDATTSIKLDQYQKMQILNDERQRRYDFKTAWNGQDPDPMTSDRYLSTYSCDERSILYKYAVAHTTGPPIPDEFNILLDDNQKEQKSLTMEEKLSKERDAKRRRTKYKSVHTNRKSHTEVMKEVIENQMDMYNEWLVNKDRYSKCPTQVKEETVTNEVPTEVKKHTHDEDRPNSSVSRHSAHSGSSNKKYEHESHHNDKYYKRENGHHTSHSEHKSRYDRHIDRSPRRDRRDYSRDSHDHYRRKSRDYHHSRDSHDRRRHSSERNDKKYRYRRD